MTDLSREDLEALASGGNQWAQQELIKHYGSEGVHDSIHKAYTDNEMLQEAFDAKPTIASVDLNANVGGNAAPISQDTIDSVAKSDANAAPGDENGESMADVLRHDKGHDDWHASHGDPPCESEEDCKRMQAKYAEKALRSELQKEEARDDHGRWTSSESTKVVNGYEIKPGANLAGADLKGANLRGADLQNANLKGADLSGADLYNANLVGANLTGANLTGASLTGADLYNANLSNANLSDANRPSLFSLRNADLTGADLTGANLNGANLNDAVGVPAQYAEKALQSELKKYLQQAILRGGDEAVRASEILLKEQERDDHGRFASGLGDKALDKSERADAATERSTQKPGGVSEKTAASAHAAAARANAAAAKAYDDIGDKKAAANHAGLARYHAESAMDHRGNMNYVGASAAHIDSADTSVASAQKAAESVSHLDPYQ